LTGVTPLAALAGCSEQRRPNRPEQRFRLPNRPLLHPQVI
jgi:hypothetical protein